MTRYSWSSCQAQKCWWPQGLESSSLILNDDVGIYNSTEQNPSLHYAPTPSPPKKKSCRKPRTVSSVTSYLQQSSFPLEQEPCPAGSNLAEHQWWQMHTQRRVLSGGCIERIRLRSGPQTPLCTAESWQLVKRNPGPQLDLLDDLPPSVASDSPLAWSSWKMLWNLLLNFAVLWLSFFPPFPAV